MYLTDDPIDREQLIARAWRPSDGAMVVFEGIVRNHHGGREVVSIHYEAYRPMAEKEIHRIVNEVARDFPAVSVEIRHRLGLVQVGEASIVIVCASPHREEAYKSSRRLIDEIKERVPIWKRERSVDGEEWQGWQGGGMKRAE